MIVVQKVVLNNFVPSDPGCGSQRLSHPDLWGFLRVKTLQGFTTTTTTTRFPV